MGVLVGGFMLGGGGKQVRETRSLLSNKRAFSLNCGRRRNSRRNPSGFPRISPLPPQQSCARANDRVGFLRGALSVVFTTFLITCAERKAACQVTVTPHRTNPKHHHRL